MLCMYNHANMYAARRISVYIIKLPLARPALKPFNRSTDPFKISCYMPFSAKLFEQDATCSSYSTIYMIYCRWKKKNVATRSIHLHMLKGKYSHAANTNDNASEIHL